MLGTVPHAELLAEYRDRAPDCVVLPSLDLGGGIHEGLSVALVEAMAHAIPAISTTTGGQPELLGQGAGVLVPPRDVTALAAALGGVLGSPDLHTELSRAGRRRIEQEFDVDIIADELVRRFAGEPAGDAAAEPAATGAR
jgi:glycosyltransferase involved in cell wall biosynthesis